MQRFMYIITNLDGLYFTAHLPVFVNRKNPKFVP
jgi:hypothetical protein